MKKEKLIIQNKSLVFRVFHPFPGQPGPQFSFSPLPVSWLISSLLFAFISIVVAPVFWKQMEFLEESTPLTAFNLLLGVSGLLVFMLEPIIWHNNVFGETEKPPQKASSSTDLQKIKWGAFTLNFILPLM